MINLGTTMVLNLVFQIFHNKGGQSNRWLVIPSLRNRNLRIVTIFDILKMRGTVHMSNDAWSSTVGGFASWSVHDLRTFALTWPGPHALPHFICFINRTTSSLFSKIRPSFLALAILRISSHSCLKSCASNLAQN